MKILVTGSTGFLGTTLCQHLDSLGFEVTKSNSSICDLTKTDEAKDLCASM